MKPNLLPLLTVVTFFFNLDTFAQITFEHSYSTPLQYQVPVHLTTLENSGDKYVVYDASTITVYLYNLNHTLWKSISVDTIALGVSPSLYYDGKKCIAYVKETLFDLDNEVEFLWQMTGRIGTNYKYLTVVVNETGPPLAIFDSSYVMDTDEGEYYQPIRNTTNGTKLFTKNGFTGEYKVYGLPGTLTCNPCGGINGISNPGNNSGRLPSKAFPVPTDKSVIIQYELPKTSRSGVIEIYSIGGERVETISIGPAFTDITVPVNGLNAGVYLYSVKSENGNIVSQGKFVITR